MQDVALGPTSVVQAVAVALRDQLLDGSYRPGEVLRDTELVDQFGVARPTIRAAVQELVADGLLVRDRSRSARLPEFTHAEVVDLYVARRTVELAAVDLIADRRPSIESIAEVIDRLAALPGTASWQQAADLDIEFHRRLVAAAGSQRLARMFDAVANESRLLIAFQRPLYHSPAELAAEHFPIFEALRAKRYGRCRQLLEQHFTEAIAAMTATPATA